jgi:hypothetical protein
MTLTTGLIVVLGVGALAWLLRGRSEGGGIERDLLSGRVDGAGGIEPAEAEPPDPDEAEDASDEVAVITSDGWTFLPFEKGVELLAPANPEQLAEEQATRAVARSRVTGMLSVGDLLAARVVRGAPGVDPWRLEGLGRDHEYLSWSFETEEAARTALELLERIVVRAPEGPEGEPGTPGAAEFEQARRIQDETVRELATMPESEEPEEKA